MDNLSALVRFEYKKIFKKQSNIVILLIAVFLTVFSSLGPLMGNYYIKGEIFESNYEGMKRDREYIRSLSGREIGSDILSEAIGAYSLIPPTDGRYTDTDEYQQYARPYSEIYYIVRKSYSLNDWKEMKLLTEEDIKSFYDVRQDAVEMSIEGTTMSPAEKSASVSLSRQVRTPFIYSYTGGYTRFFSQMYTTAVLICFICSICIAPLFAGEYTDKTDSLILSSKYGKNKVIHAKLITGISFSVLLTIMLTIVSYITVMMFFGREGGEAPIQIFLPLSIHPFTIVQAALLYFTVVLMGNLLSASFVMLLSARLKSPFMVMVIMTVITVFPMFVNVPENTLWIYHLFNLIPVNMFHLSRILDKFSVDLFGVIVQPYEAAIIFSVVSGIILMPLTYSGFKKHSCQ